MNNYDFYDTVEKEKSNISFQSLYKQLVNNSLYWSTQNFNYEIKSVEDGNSFKKA